jgi:SulP family sulfate permease
MIVIGFGMFDQWSRALWGRIREGSRDRDALWALATVAVVCGVTVVLGFVWGVLVGVAMSFVLFVAALNRSLLRSVATGETRGSRRIYAPEQARILRERGAQLRILDVEGAIFFGTAHKFEGRRRSRQQGRAS